MKFNANIFKQLGLAMAGNKCADIGQSEKEKEKTFKSFFGVHWDTCEITWALLDDHGKYKKREPKYLLWMLFFSRCTQQRRYTARLSKNQRRK